MIVYAKTIRGITQAAIDHNAKMKRLQKFKGKWWAEYETN